MIRFVEFTGIDLDDTKSFGFFNTVTDQFLMLNGTHSFEDVEEFEDMYTSDCGYDFERLRNKIPKKWFDKSTETMSKEQKSQEENKSLHIGGVRSADVNIVDSDIATIEAMHDLLLDDHGYSLDFRMLKKARELTAKMYKAFYSKEENQIDCGYCAKEKSCKMRDPNVNKAKQGCKELQHWQDYNRC